MIGLLPWVKLPSTWIEKHGLKRFKSKDSLADEIAALMVLVAIAHRSSVVDGSCRVTYEVLSAATQISRAKISSGLDVLADRGIVIREPNGRSTGSVRQAGVNYGMAHWDHRSGGLCGNA